MILESIAEYLEDSGVGTVGADIFIGDFPAEVSNCLMLVASAQKEQENYKDIREIAVDLWVRNKSTELAVNKLFDCQQWLHLKSNYEITGFHIYFSGTTNIQDMDRDGENRKLGKISARFIYRDLNNIIS